MLYGIEAQSSLLSTKLNVNAQSIGFRNILIYAFDNIFEY